LKDFTKEKLTESQQVESEWIKLIEKMPIVKKTTLPFKKFWQRRNKRNKMLN